MFPKVDFFYFNFFSVIIFQALNLRKTFKIRFYCYQPQICLFSKYHRRLFSHLLLDTQLVLSQSHDYKPANLLLVDYLYNLLQHKLLQVLFYFYHTNHAPIFLVELQAVRVNYLNAFRRMTFFLLTRRSVTVKQNRNQINSKLG